MGRIWKEMREKEPSKYYMKITLFPMFLTKKSNLLFLLIQLMVLSKARGMEGVSVLRAQLRKRNKS